MKMNLYRFILLTVFVLLIYFSKISDYKNDLDFYKSVGSFEILKIQVGKGVKVYYSDNEFFYLDTYVGTNFEVGDNIIKTDSIVKVFRNGKLKGQGEILKPADNYWEYFF